MDTTAVLVTGGMALFFLGAGIGFQLGWLPPRKRRAKWFHTWYRNEDLPRYQREMIGALIPMGIACTLWAIAFTGIGSRGFEVGLTLVGLGFLVLAIVFFFWHPAWTKPSWLREAERREEAGEPLDDLPMPAEGRTMTVSRREYRIAWLLCGALVVGGIAIGQVTGAIVGLGVALPILLAMKVRDSRRKRSA